MTQGQVIAVRADGAQFVFDSINDEGVISGFLVSANGNKSQIGFMDMFTKVGDWERVDQ